MKLSKYVRIVPYNDEEVLVYNTVNHSIIELPSFFTKDTNLEEYIDQESICVLRDMEFLETSDSIIENKIEEYVINKNKLFVSLELNLSCNLRCPYCYQLEKGKKGLIEDSDLDNLVKYYEKVYEIEPYKELFLKVLGGEPTLVWSKLIYIHEKTAEFCREKGVKYHLLIDTNGTLIDDLLELQGYDSLLLTIPLTYKACHDQVRFDAHGKGTYDAIISNVNTLMNKKKNLKIVIRYNVDANNIEMFGDFLKDIKSKLFFKPLVSVNYTAELNNNEDYKTNLTYRDFILWSSTKAIDLLVEEDLPVTISPIISIEECQFRSRYSIKLFCDGTFGSCAMSFFDDDKMTISEMLRLFDVENNFWNNKKKQTLLTDKECIRCDSLFICGGTNKLPCIMALDKKMCEEKQFGIVLGEFLKRYMNYKQLGRNNLFVVFENGEGYR